MLIRFKFIGFHLLCKVRYRHIKIFQTSLNSYFHFTRSKHEFYKYLCFQPPSQVPNWHPLIHCYDKSLHTSGICFIYDMRSLFTQILLVYIRVKYKSTETGWVRVKPQTVTRIYYYIRIYTAVYIYKLSVVYHRQSVMQVFGFRFCCHYHGRCHRHHRFRKNFGKAKAGCVGKLLTLSVVFFFALLRILTGWLSQLFHFFYTHCTKSFIFFVKKTFYCSFVIWMPMIWTNFSVLLYIKSLYYFMKI